MVNTLQGLSAWELSRMVFEWINSKFKEIQLQKAQIQAEADQMIIVAGLSILNPTWRMFFKQYPFYDVETDSIDLKELDIFIDKLKHRTTTTTCEDCFIRKYYYDHEKEVREFIRLTDMPKLAYSESLELAYLKEIVNEVVGEYSELQYSFSNNSKEFKEKLSSIIEEYYSFDGIKSNFEYKIYQKNKEIERLQSLLDEKPVKDNRPVIRGSKIYNKFRLNVLKRDEVCQCCGSTENLHVHHISSYKYDKEKRADTHNGIVLCKDCHSQFHSLYGKGHKNNPVNFAKFMREYGKPMQLNLDYVADEKNIFEDILGGK